MSTSTNSGIGVAKPVLLAGAFSYPNWGATFGDTEALRTVETWLQELRIDYDVARHAINGAGGADIETLDPKAYNTFIFVCGPWFDKNRDHLLPRFAHCRKIGVNLSILVEGHGFDAVFPRDDGNVHSPDLAFQTSPSETVPLVGVIFAPRQTEYQGLQRHDDVSSIVLEYLRGANLDFIRMDTIYRENETGFATVRQFENVVRRLDLVVTSRLHGLVFALKNHIPAVAIDPIAGGGKVTAQAAAVKWPYLLDGSRLATSQIADAVAACLDPRVRYYLADSAAIARSGLEELKRRFLSELR